MVTIIFDIGAGVVSNTARVQGSLIMIVNATEATFPSTVAFKVNAYVPLSSKVALFIVTCPLILSALFCFVIKERF